MKRVALATVILSAIALTAALAQTRAIGGRVVADDTGDPIVNARVTLVTTGPAAPVVLTDHEGRFTLTAPPTRVTIAANKSGYSRREATANAADTSIEIRLPRGAAISGRIVDEFGDPVMGVRVLVEKPSAASDRFAGEAATTTDDRGEYRLGSLQAGTFNVAVVTMTAPTRQEIGPNQFRINSEPGKTYYPGVTSSSEAEPLRLRPGDEKSGTDIVITGSQAMEQRQAGLTMVMAPGPLRPAVDTAPKTGVIRGRVVSTDGRPLPRALVRTMSRVVVAAPNGSGTTVQFQPLFATADDDGRFEFSELAAGSFRIGATKVGYSLPEEPASSGVLGMNAGVAVNLADGETRERVDVTLAKWGAMAGHVFDEQGDPLQGATVQLLQVRYQAGRRRLIAARDAANPTDDLGRFRIYGVPPGQYIVSATVGSVQSADVPGYTRTYFPGTPTASEAQFAPMVLSQETAGIDFSMARARTARISGTLLNAAGEPSTTGSVRLSPSQRSSVTSVSVGARLMPDGRFEFPNVTPGQYVIQVDRGRRNSSTEGEFGALPVAVDGTDVTGLVIQTSGGSSITGHVTFDTIRGTSTPRQSQIEITPVPIDADQSTASPANADIRDDWSFAVNGVNGPRRLQLLRVPAKWTLREIRVRGIDVADRVLAFGTKDQSLTDVEVVLTDRINEVSGTIVDDHAKPAPGSHLIVFAPDRDRWYPSSRYLRQATAGADGAITLPGLPPGTYYAAAVARLPADGDDAWQDPAFLESLIPHVSTFTLGDGQKQVLNLKLDAR